MRPIRHVFLPAVLALLAVALTFRPGEAADKLVAHPMKDAKAGEYMRFELTGERGFTRHTVQTVLEVKDGKAWIEEWFTDEKGERLTSLLWSGWARIPDTIKPNSYQEVIEDEMVQLELGGQKVQCRRFLVSQPENPPMPEPKVSREVWFSNDLPGWGRVKEIQAETTKTALAWGTMSADDLAKAIEARDKRESGQKGD